MKREDFERLKKKIAFIEGEKRRRPGVYKLTAECRIDDPSKYEKLPTGIYAVDEKLHGGIPRGVSYTIISGAAGEGKSTLVSQIQASTISNTDYTCITYSGEMSDGLVKFQLYRQLAGHEGMIDGMSVGRGPEYLMKNGVREEIEMATKYQSILFDPTGGDLHMADPWSVWQQSMEASAEAGIEIIIVDNLMTVVAALARSMPRLNDYERQREFCDWAARFAKKYNVWLILVAHTKKPVYGAGKAGSGTAYDISGASEIINLAGTIINYGKYSDDEVNEEGSGLKASDRKSKVQKNRLYGDYDTKGTTVHFDPMTCRIWSDPEDKQDYRYPWREKFKDKEYMNLITGGIDPVTAKTKSELQTEAEILLKKDDGDIQAVIEAMERSIG